MLPSFLFSRLAGPIGAGASILLLAALIFVGLGSLGKNHTIHSLQDEIHNPKTGYIVQLQAARADLAQCRSNRITLEEAARRQNAAVEQSRLEGERKAAELDRIAADYRNKLAAANGQVRTILNRKGSGNVCADADALILEAVR